MARKPYNPRKTETKQETTPIEENVEQKEEVVLMVPEVEVDIQEEPKEGEILMPVVEEEPISIELDIDLENATIEKELNLEFEEVVTAKKEEVAIEQVVPKNKTAEKIYKDEYEKINKVVEKKDEKPHYVFGRNEKGTIERVDNKEKAKEQKEMEFDKKKYLNEVLEYTVKELQRSEADIEIHEAMKKFELDPNKINTIQRKIDALKENVDFVNKKIKAINTLLN